MKDNIKGDELSFMKLVTFQSIEALEYLIKNKELICEEKYIDKKYLKTYDWIISKMKKINHKAKYPLWCWVKCYNGICPPKVKGNKIHGFDVKITFHKNIDEVLITDFRRYSFVLNNKYLPSNKKDINKTVNDLEIIKSHDRCITTDSDILQGCIWDIKLNEVEKIEILNDDGYAYGSLNYIRSNGKRLDWINDFYKKLK